MPTSASQLPRPMFKPPEYAFVLIILYRLEGVYDIDPSIQLTFDPPLGLRIPKRMLEKLMSQYLCYGQYEGYGKYNTDAGDLYSVLSMPLM